MATVTIRPTSDVRQLRATQSTGSTLYGCVDESTPDTDERAAHNHGGSKTANVSGGSTVMVTTGSGSTAAAANHTHAGSIAIDGADAHDHTVGDTLSANFTPRHIKRVFIRRMS